MVIEDKQYLQLFNDIANQLEAAVIVFNQRANGITDRAELLALRREQNEVLAEAVARHKRAMDYMEGKPVEPQTHFADAVLVATVGGGAQF